MLQSNKKVNGQQANPHSNAEGVLSPPEETLALGSARPNKALSKQG